MARVIRVAAEVAVRDVNFPRHAALAGLAGGVSFMMAQMLLMPLLGQSPWAPPRMIAAIAFEWFSGARNWVTLATHVIFGITTALVYVALARRAPTIDRRRDLQYRSAARA